MSDDTKQKMVDTKQKMMSEDEHKRILCAEIERLRNARLSYSIAHGWSSNGLYPRLAINIEGGDQLASHNLAIKIEELLLQHAKENPPSDADFSRTRPHFLPGDSQRSNPES